MTGPSRVTWRITCDYCQTSGLSCEAETDSAARTGVQCDADQRGWFTLFLVDRAVHQCPACRKALHATKLPEAPTDRPKKNGRPGSSHDVLRVGRK